MPKVSIIIPVYSVEQYLKRCLESVVNQTLKDIEIICVNDCSPDNSLVILQEYAQKDNRIKIIDFKENQGAAAARNVGIENATGEYLGAVDGDDWIDADFYEKLYNEAQKENADIVIADYYNVIDENGKEKKYQYLNTKKIAQSKYHLFSHCSAIYRRKMIIENNVKYLSVVSVDYDYPYIMQALYYAKKISIVESTFYYYFTRENSASMQFRTLDLTKDSCLSRIEVFKFFHSHLISVSDYSVVAERFLYSFLEMLTKSPLKYHIALRNDFISLDNLIDKQKYILNTQTKEVVDAFKANDCEKWQEKLKQWQKFRCRETLKELKATFLLNKNK